MISKLQCRERHDYTCNVDKVDTDLVSKISCNAVNGMTIPVTTREAVKTVPVKRSCNAVNGMTIPVTARVQEALGIMKLQCRERHDYTCNTENERLVKVDNAVAMP